MTYDHLMKEVSWCYGMYGGCIAQARQTQAKLSHVRIRTNTEDQAKSVYENALSDGRFDRAEFAAHGEKQILWLHFKEPKRHYHHNGWGDLSWAEVTPPNPEHTHGVDALIYKVPGLEPAYGYSIGRLLRIADPSEPGSFIIRLQGKSAEDIVGIVKAA